jgi:hypothetical protein
MIQDIVPTGMLISEDRIAMAKYIGMTFRIA